MAGRAYADSGAIDLGDQTVRLTRINARGAGPANLGGGGITADLSGAAEANGAFSPADARALADMMAPVGVTPALNAALRSGLAAWRVEAPLYRATFDNGPLTVRLGRPARAAFKDGAVIVAAGGGAPLAAVGPGGIAGALRLTSSGKDLPSLDLAVTRYQATTAGLSGAGHLTAKGDVLPIEGLDLAADINLTQGAGGATLRLAGCGPLSFTAFKAGADTLLTGFKTEVCPAAEPLTVVGPSRWRAAAKLNNAVAGLPAADAAMADGVVDIRLAGAGSAKPTGTFDVAAARITDVMTPVRFSPLSLSGRLSLAEDRINGRMAAALAAKAGELAAFDVVHDLPSGEGRAMLEPTRVTFVEGGLQPGDIAPMAGGIVTRAAGPVQVSAQFGWGPAGVGGSARAETAGLDFSAAGGRVMGLKGAVDFPAVTPLLLTGADQRLTAARFETVLPVTDLDLRFSLSGEALTVQAASATVAKGAVRLETLVLPLKPGGTAASTLRAEGVDVGEILSGLNLSDSVQMQASVGAVLPFSITPEGLRIAGGRIAAEGPGRLSIKRAALTGVSAGGGAATAESSAPGAPPPAPVPINAVQDFA